METAAVSSVRSVRGDIRRIVHVSARDARSHSARHDRRGRGFRTSTNPTLPVSAQDSSKHYLKGVATKHALFDGSQHTVVVNKLPA